MAPSPAPRRAPRQPRLLYDELRGEWYDPETGEVVPAPLEHVFVLMQKPDPGIELPKRQYKVRSSIERMALVYLTRLQYCVGLEESVRVRELPTGAAPDRDLVREVTSLLRKVGSTDGLPRHGVAGALVIEAVGRMRRRFVTPGDLVKARTTGVIRLRLPGLTARSILYVPEETFPAKAEVEESDVRRALKVIRKRLRGTRASS